MEVMTTYPQEITFGEVRILRPRGLSIAAFTDTAPRSKWRRIVEANGVAPLSTDDTR